MSNRLGPKLHELIGAEIDAPYVNDMRSFLRSYDQLTQISVLDKDLIAPPVSPSNGDAYIIRAGTTPTGAWANHDGDIAVWSTDIYTNNTNTLVPGWEFYTPNAGWLIYVTDESVYYNWNGTQFNVFSPFDQLLNTNSQVTHDFLELNRDEGLQLSGALNAYIYHGESGPTIGTFLESEAGSDAGWFIRPGEHTCGAFLANGQVVLGGGITPIVTGGVNPVCVSITQSDFAVMHYSWFYDTMYGTKAEWETGGGIGEINWSNKYVNTTISPDTMTGTGIGNLYQQFYYDPDTREEADIGSTKWQTEGNWTADPTSRNSTMILQNVKNGVLQDAVKVDSSGNVFFGESKMFTSTAIPAIANATDGTDVITQFNTLLDGFRTQGVLLT